jgi:hypothetical protein
MRSITPAASARVAGTIDATDAFMGAMIAQGLLDTDRPGSYGSLTARVV